ncbi:hypothetical protein [Azonexus sp.]|uniref:hypothetical protein n=1 Tax=Azonexus sp. TaxID=1872668 RepID=UPI0035B17673
MDPNQRSARGNPLANAIARFDRRSAQWFFIRKAGPSADQSPPARHFTTASQGETDAQ